MPRRHRTPDPSPATDADASTDNDDADDDAPPRAGPGGLASLRLDKWLWAARFYKTRSLASEAIDRGRVKVNDQAVKPARELRPGDRVSLRQGDCPLPRVVQVLGLSAARGPAPVAQALYADTPDSLAAIAAWAERRRLAPEPADSITDGRPTKQARRDIADWERWSARLSDDAG